MKVYCIDNKDVSLSVTVGKWYDVSFGDKISDETSYWIINENLQRRRISKSKFLTIEQIREKKLNILGI
jgi:hypothetical protein